MIRGFAVECRRLSNPKTLREAFSQARRNVGHHDLFPLVVVPYLSDPVSGSARISIPGVNVTNAAMPISLRLHKIALWASFLGPRGLAIPAMAKRPPLSVPL